jgi:hypothetical protein
MGEADPVIRSVKARKIPLIEFESTDGFRYTVDLHRFRSVYCFPEKQEDWNEVFQMDGDRIVWKNRFEIHVDQAVSSTVKKEKIRQPAAS